MREDSKAIRLTHMSKTRKKSWQEKLADSKGFPQIAKIDSSKTKKWGTGTFVIPAPLEVDAAMKQVRKGKLTTIDALRSALAKKHGTTIACPLTTGIFAWIAAHAANESESTGAKLITPYWRTLKAKGELNPKYPGGIANLQRRLEEEGHEVIQRGKRYFVADYESSLTELKL